ncbi:cationic amino acid transporter 2 [Elysia marginata]|uniref:Cationic amino acid transporter 2 n=1 Tax=Elysia marginata TaxID=1093978 RepID=A0AAV4JAJ6_9GAST|nr:cationic amino acid transporter 2 [Elysia marginata]
MMMMMMVVVVVVVVMMMVVCGGGGVDDDDDACDYDNDDDDGGGGGDGDDDEDDGGGGSSGGSSGGVDDYGEETKNPQRATPIAIIASLAIVFISYFSVSVVVTMMCPYFLLDPKAALPQVFKRAGWGFAAHIISVGALCGLSASLLTGMVPLPRILYAMGSDGVIFRFMGEINQRTKTPMVGTAISGIFAGAMAMLFDLHELVDMMSIGTLLAYTLVPFLPWLPMLSVLINIYLMMKLSNATWIRFGIWMAVGFLIYFTYGIKNAGSGTDSGSGDGSRKDVLESQAVGDDNSVQQQEHTEMSNLVSEMSSFTEKDSLIDHSSLGS